MSDLNCFLKSPFAPFWSLIIKSLIHLEVNRYWCSFFELRWPQYLQIRARNLPEMLALQSALGLLADTSTWLAILNTSVYFVCKSTAFLDSCLGDYTYVCNVQQGPFISTISFGRVSVFFACLWYRTMTASFSENVYLQRKEYPGILQTCKFFFGSDCWSLL